MGWPNDAIFLPAESCFFGGYNNMDTLLPSTKETFILLILVLRSCIAYGAFK